MSTQYHIQKGLKNQDGEYIDWPGPGSWKNKWALIGTLKSGRQYIHQIVDSEAEAQEALNAMNEAENA
jgi:hypothetical protein